ncbi:hypothetical protein FOG18_07240 [Legionella israelensis]|uniref:hypothetical protein n=1 Tax=Legionella israelensis TaxID=454 RepID=UPI00117DCF76|nr:hypothetical protein [Legionella israelensis]QDP72365.1 hypothetical protein FOG18_07240 [Legionella israelensis]
MMLLKNDISDFLDSARGVSSIVVLLAHVNRFFLLPIYDLNGPLQIIQCYLASGAVIAFFVINGFVISLSTKNSMLVCSYKGLSKPSER